MLFHRLCEKRVHRVALAARFTRNRNRMPYRFLKRPVAARLLRNTRLCDDWWSNARGTGCHRRVPRRTCVDPFLKGRDLFRREFGAVHGHGWFFEACNQPVDAALICIAGYQGRSTLAALQRALSGAQVKLGELESRTVTLPA